MIPRLYRNSVGACLSLLTKVPAVMVWEAQLAETRPRSNPGASTAPLCMHRGVYAGCSSEVRGRVFSFALDADVDARANATMLLQ